MDSCIIALTRRGVETAVKIKSHTGADLYVYKDYGFDGCTVMDKPLTEFVGTIFESYRTIIFVSACGIAVRAIAPFIRDKRTDPGVIVTDDNGTNVISLLSGHLGRANENTLKIASLLGARPVVTTSSDVNGLESVDMTALRLGLRISDMEAARRVTALMLDGGRILFAENGIPADGSDINSADGIINVSNRKMRFDCPHVDLVPQNIVAGIGCRRGIGAGAVIGAVRSEFERLNLYPESLRLIGSISLKSDEGGLLEAAGHFGVNILFAGADELASCGACYTGSDFVREVTGVGGVSVPAAYYFSERNGAFLSQKTIYGGVTISLYEEQFLHSTRSKETYNEDK